MTDERHQIDVTHGGQLVESSQCRLLTLPDGRRGAIWRGLAFPIDEKDCIDVSQEGVPPSLCPSQGIGVQPRAFVLLPADQDIWVLLAGSAVVRDQAILSLRSSGATILRSGRWLGDTVDGFDADWFVRIARPLDDTPFKQLASSLAHTLVQAEAPDSVRLRIIEADLARSRAREASLREELERARKQQPKSPEKTFDDQPVPPTAPDVPENLQATVKSSPPQIEAIEEPVAEETSRDRIAATVKPRKALSAEIETTFSVLLSRIVLLRDSLVVASGEFRDRRSLYRCLKELQDAAGQLPSGWKKLRDANGWWERHVSDGEDDSGRIYIRRLDKNSSWQLLISHKEQQARDIAWIRRQS